MYLSTGTGLPAKARPQGGSCWGLDSGPGLDQPLAVLVHASVGLVQGSHTAFIPHHTLEPSVRTQPYEPLPAGGTNRSRLGNPRRIPPHSHSIVSTYPPVAGSLKSRV